MGKYEEEEEEEIQQTSTPGRNTPTSGNKSGGVDKSAMPLTMMGMMALGLIDQTTNTKEEEKKEEVKAPERNRTLGNSWKTRTKKIMHLDRLRRRHDSSSKDPEFPRQ